jgi:hypothetical protein
VSLRDGPFLVGGAVAVDRPLLAGAAVAVAQADRVVRGGQRVGVAEALAARAGDPADRRGAAGPAGV